MNSKQRRRSKRYWLYTIELEEPTWELGIKRCKWLADNFGHNNKGLRYVWAGWNPTWKKIT